MKKLLFLLLALPLFISSCSEDDEMNYQNSDVFGIWEFQSARVKKIKTNNDKVTKFLKKEITEGKFYDFMIFTIDGNYTFNKNDVDAGFRSTYTLEGNTITFDYLATFNNVHISDNILSFDRDETKYYLRYLEHLQSFDENVVVSKVITTYTYKR